jgi:DNA-binding MarR family transcriptional regulator
MPNALGRDSRVRIVVDPADRRRRVVERTEVGARTLESLGGLEASMFPVLADPAAFRDQLLQIIRHVGGDPQISYGDGR